MKLIDNKFVLVLLLPTLIFDQILSEQNLQVIWERCDGFCNEKFCNINVTCRPLNRTSKWIIFDINFHKEVILKAPIIIEIVAYKKFTTQYRPFMLKLKAEYCHEVAERTHPYFKLFHSNDIKNAGTILDPCPLTGNRHIKSQASSTRMEILVPTGEWKVQYTLSKYFNDTKSHILTADFYYTMKATTAEEF